MSVRETGNPVFDYRAGFRRWSALLQSVLLSAGLLAVLAAGILRVVSLLTTPAAEILAAAGAGVFSAGFAWGIYWRRALRNDFRRTFGPLPPAKSASNSIQN